MKKHHTTHEENLARLALIEGQVRGLQRMIDEGKYCIDIITQIQAVQSALSAVSRRILHKHLTHCVADSLNTGNEEDTTAKIDELLDVMKRMCK
jgi:DNA-binding FrmR family transcriptional regulator